MKDTSLLTAACRAKFCALNRNGDDKFGDYFAQDIVADKINMFDDIIFNKFPPVTLDVFGFRSQFTDEYILKGALPSQIVILGAGMDTLGARFVEIFKKNHTRIFEVDLPSTQQTKKQLVSSIETYDDSAITYVECDFTSQNFMDCMATNGFDSQKQSTFIWMGVSYYLPIENVVEILKIVLEINHHNEILFDYAIDVNHTDDGIMRSEQALKDMKEPIMCKFADITPILAAIGYKNVEEISLFAYALKNGGSVYPNDKRYLRFVHASGKQHSNS